MKVGNLAKFKKTGVLATIVEIGAFGTYDDDMDKFVRLHVHGDWHAKNPTGMSIEMFNRTAEIINEEA